MTDNLEGILRRVASGELSVEEAEPLIAAASGEPGTPDSGPVRKTGRFGWPRFSGPGGDANAASSDESSAPGATGARRVVRLQVMEGGRSVVNLRIPMSLAGLAGSVLPGLSNEHADRLREAIRSGTVGRILEVQDEDGDGVIISTE
jgi:hypothetical protein